MSSDIHAMPPTKAFEFLDAALPEDGGLRLVLADVPPGYPLDAGMERRKLCFRLGLQ